MTKFRKKNSGFLQGRSKVLFANGIGSVRAVLAAVCLAASGVAGGVILGSMAPQAASASTQRGTLYVGNINGATVNSFALPNTGDISPTTTLQSKTNSIDAPYGMTADAKGDLWESSFSDNSLVEFSANQLSTGGSLTPMVTIRSSNLQGPVGLVFDAKGDLWVAGFDSGDILEFTPIQLKSSGTITPAIRIAGPHTGISGPESDAISPSGDLWIANDTNSTLVAFTPAELAAGGTQSPAFTLRSDSTMSISAPFGLLFDRSGNLWVSNQTATTLVRFSPAQLAASGSPAPSVTLASDTKKSIDYPSQMIFDGAGDLWVATTSSTGGTGAAVEFSPNLLRVSGNPAPSSILSGANTKLKAPSGLAFIPPPTNYLMVGSDGGTFAFGATNYEGSLPSLGVHVGDIVGAVPTPDDKGYLMIGSDGGTFAFGDANFEGSLPGLGVAVNNIVGVVPTPDDKGYLMIGSDGGTFAFGDANFEGSLPALDVHVNNIVGVVPTLDDKGYLMIGRDGGTFAFGDANFEGSLPGLGVHVSNIAGVVPSPDDLGYLMMGSDGGTFAFGDVNFEGSLPALGVTVNNIVTVLPTADEKGYIMVGNDGGTFSFGDAMNVGSLPGLGVHVSNIVTAFSA